MGRAATIPVACAQCARDIMDMSAPIGGVSHTTHKVPRVYKGCICGTREAGDCYYGYECSNGSGCQYAHTQDQKLFFKWRERADARNRAPSQTQRQEKLLFRCDNDKQGKTCKHYDAGKCKFAHARDGPTCQFDERCTNVNCPYVHTRDNSRRGA